MGKFDCPVSEVLHRVSLDGTAESVGDVTTFGSIHHGLGRVMCQELDSHFSGALRDAGIGSHQIPDGVYWIVHEDDQGFVESSGYLTEAEYRAAFTALENRWAEFDTAT